MQEKNNRKANFFSNLQFLLTESGLKKSQIADAIGIHHISFYRYFTEKRIPKRSVLESLASFFKVDVVDLLSEDLTKKRAGETLRDNGQTSLLPSDVADFEEFVRKRTAELQQEINRFAADILDKYNQRL